MKKELKVCKHGDEGYLYINDIPYVAVSEKEGTTSFKRVDKKEIEKMVKEITPKLVNHISIERIVKGALKSTPLENLASIYKKLTDKKRKRKASIKQKDGCLYLSIGGRRLDIQD